MPEYHLYLCGCDNVGLENHLAFRDYLRAHSESVRAYGVLKRQLATQFPHDIESYVEGKTRIIVETLRAAGLPPDRLDAIARANRK